MATDLTAVTEALMAEMATWQYRPILSYEDFDRLARAAADTLRTTHHQEALNAAAEATRGLIAGPLPVSQWGDGYRRGVTVAEQMLRDRANHTGTNNNKE